MYRLDKPKEPKFMDVFDADKSRISTMSTWENLDQIRTIAREHRETVHALKIRCEKLEYQLTYMMQQIQVLKARLRVAEREKNE